MKTITEIRKEKPYYFVCINGDIPFESDSVKECKDYLIKHLKENGIDEDEAYRCFIGMYNIDLM